MTTAQSHAVMPQELRLRENLSVWIPEAQCQLVVSQPALDPTLWNEYLHGALRSYTKHGVECVLDFDAISEGSDTQLLFAAVDAKNEVVGGVRVVGPLRSADDAHAVVEWEGNAGVGAVRKMITDRLPFGVVELKNGWVDSDFPHSGAIVAALGRTPLLSMALLEVQFVLGSTATHALKCWRSSGAVVAKNIPATIYPDERYRTKLVWWNRRTFAKHAEPEQLSRMHVESRKLMRDVDTLCVTTTTTVGASQ